MNTSEKIYCIIATYNAEHWIEKCLNSILQSSVSCTVIVVDNKSTDRTAKIITARYPQVRFIQNNVNAGFGKANNIALQQAYDEGADYFFLLNQDAWVEPNTIELLVKKHRQHPEYGILSPLQLYNSSKLDRKFKSYLKGKGDEIIHSLSAEERETIMQVRFVNAAIWLVSRKCIETVGLFAPIFDHYGEDQNYAHRCKFHQFRIGIYPKAIGYHEREQNRPKEKHTTVNKLLVRDKHFCLSVLLNLKHSYFRQWMFLLFNSFKEFFKSLFLLKFKTLMVVLCRPGFVMRLLELNNQRREMKNRGAFLHL